MEQSRWKSPILWASLVAQTVTLLLLFNLISVSDADTVNRAVAIILQILAGIGVVNNPTNSSAL